MDIRSPQPADFQNVHAFNREFLGLLIGGAPARDLLERVARRVADRLSKLTALQRERLARSPFLLFSFRERDNEFWDRIHAAGPDRALFDEPRRRQHDRTELVSTSLSFVWQLARENTYAARLVCGASQHWCERLAERPLLDVVRQAVAADVLRLRREHDVLFWSKLLHAGVVADRKVRRAARICAMQRLLTEDPHQEDRLVARAARRIERPSLRVAESIEP